MVGQQAYSSTCSSSPSIPSKRVLRLSHKAVFSQKEVGRPTSLYKGFLPNILVSFPSAGAYFSGFALGKKLYASVSEQSGERATFAPALFGGIAAEICSSVVRVPFEQMKQRLQAGQHTRLFGLFSKVLRQRGWCGVYTGLLPQILRDIPFSAIQMPMYDWLKAAYGKGDSSWLGLGVCGSAAGGVAAFLTTPLDVIKTLVMTGDFNEKKTWTTVARNIWKREGVLGFFRGVQHRFLYLSLTSFFFFLCYESVTQWIDNTLKVCQ